MDDQYPTRKPMGTFRNEDLGFHQEVDAGATAMPWIDMHTHVNEGSWNDRHEFDVGGAQAVVMVASTASVVPYRPVDAADLQYNWDAALKRVHAASRSHFFEPYVAVGIHTTRTRTENWEELVDQLPAYAELDEVAAIGESGISLNTAQVADPWSIEEQKAVVRAQMDVARETGMPFICHTPKTMKSTGDRWIRGKTEGGHNLPPADDGRSGESLDPETAKMDATVIDVELADEVGLPHDQLVIDHANEEITPFVMENTDCYLGFTLYGHASYPDIEIVADAIETYGPERIMVNTDTGGNSKHTPCALKEVMLDLLRLDIPAGDVRTVAYENPREFLGLDHLPR